MPKLDLVANKIANFTGRIEFTPETLGVSLLGTDELTVDASQFIREAASEPGLAGQDLKLVVQVRVGMRFASHEVLLGVLNASSALSPLKQKFDLSQLGSGAAEVWAALVAKNSKVAASLSTRVSRTGSILKWRISDTLGFKPWQLSWTEELPWLEVNVISGFGEHLEKAGPLDPARIIVTASAIREATIIALTQVPAWRDTWLEWCAEQTKVQLPTEPQDIDGNGDWLTEVCSYADQVVDSYVKQMHWLRDVSLAPHP